MKWLGKNWLAAIGVLVAVLSLVWNIVQQGELNAEADEREQAVAMPGVHLDIERDSVAFTAMSDAEVETLIRDGITSKEKRDYTAWVHVRMTGTNDRPAKLLGVFSCISERPDYYLRQSILDAGDPKVDVKYSALRCDLDPVRIVTARMAVHNISESHRKRFHVHTLLLYKNLRGQLYDLYQVAEYQVEDRDFQSRQNTTRQYRKTRAAQFTDLAQPRSDRKMYTASAAGAVLAALPE